jgi:hypothetical protein
MRFFLASGCPIATTTRYRCLHLREQLQMLGHEAEVAEWFEEASIDPGAALRHDIILLYRLPMSSPLAHLIERARSVGKTIVFDTDDLIFEPELIAAQRGRRRPNPFSDQSSFCVSGDDGLSLRDGGDCERTFSRACSDMGETPGWRSLPPLRLSKVSAVCSTTRLFESISSNKPINERVA